MKGREKSDRCVLPKKGGNAPGGKAATASKQARQLGLFGETADSPQGADGSADRDQSLPAKRAVPKSQKKKSRTLPAMTMEEVASEVNLREAFTQVASNKGAPGPDRQSVEQMQEQLEHLMPLLQEELLTGNYQPGMIRRVWIPKPGGVRGLGIPNVVERWIQQAIYQVLSPHYERTFHPSSHGFRPERSCHTAIAEACQHLEEGYDWVVDFDLEKFFGAPGQAWRFQRVQFPSWKGEKPPHQESSLELIEVTI